MLEEISRQRHLSPEARGRLHSIAVKPPRQDAKDEDAVPYQNIPGLAGPLLDIIRAEGESVVEDTVRCEPSLIVYDVGSALTSALWKR